MSSAHSQALARDTRRLAVVVGAAQLAWLVVWVALWAGPDRDAASWFAAPLALLGLGAVAGWALGARGLSGAAFGLGLLALTLSGVLAVAGWVTGDAGDLGVLLAAAQALTAFPLVLLAYAGARRAR